MCIAGMHAAASKPGLSRALPLPGLGSGFSRPRVSPEVALGAAGWTGSVAGLWDVSRGGRVAPAGPGTKAGPGLPGIGLCAGLGQGTKPSGWLCPERVQGLMALLVWAEPVLGAGRVLATTEKAEKTRKQTFPK